MHEGRGPGVGVVWCGQDDRGMKELNRPVCSLTHVLVRATTRRRRRGTVNGDPAQLESRVTSNGPTGRLSCC